MSERFYRPELDALRFFAFICVFCDHLPMRHPWFRPLREAGSFGLCMFFLLSAYLIVTILLRERQKTGTVELKAFAARRILRIWPLYFVVLFLSYWIGLYWPLVRVPFHAVMAFSLLVGNVYVAKHDWLQGAVNPLWSLSIEEQFYLLVPSIARFGGKRGITAVCAFTFVASYLRLAWFGVHGAMPNVQVWASSLVQFQFFAAGGLIAVALGSRQFKVTQAARIAFLIVGAGVWLFAAVAFRLHSAGRSTASQLIAGYFLVLVGTSLLFLSVLDVQVRMPKAILYFGKISYGLYLFHQLWLWMIFDTDERWTFMHSIAAHEEVGAVLALGGTFITAMVSYHFFERPILKFKERFETIRTRPA